MLSWNVFLILLSLKLVWHCASFVFQTFCYCVVRRRKFYDYIISATRNLSNYLRSSQSGPVKKVSLGQSHWTLSMDKLSLQTPPFKQLEVSHSATQLKEPLPSYWQRNPCRKLNNRVAFKFVSLFAESLYCIRPITLFLKYFKWTINHFEDVQHTWSHGKGLQGSTHVYPSAACSSAEHLNS